MSLPTHEEKPNRVGGETLCLKFHGRIDYVPSSSSPTRSQTRQCRNPNKYQHDFLGLLNNFKWYYKATQNPILNITAPILHPNTIQYNSPYKEPFKGSLF